MTTFLKINFYDYKMLPIIPPLLNPPKDIKYPAQEIVYKNKILVWIPILMQDMHARECLIKGYRLGKKTVPVPERERNSLENFLRKKYFPNDYISFRD